MRNISSFLILLAPLPLCPGLSFMRLQILQSSSSVEVIASIINIYFIASIVIIIIIIIIITIDFISSIIICTMKAEAK